MEKHHCAVAFPPMLRIVCFSCGFAIAAAPSFLPARFVAVEIPPSSRIEDALVRLVRQLPVAIAPNPNRSVIREYQRA